MMSGKNVSHVLIRACGKKAITALLVVSMMMQNTALPVAAQDLLAASGEGATAPKEDVDALSTSSGTPVSSLGDAATSPDPEPAVVPDPTGDDTSSEDAPANPKPVNVRLDLPEEVTLSYEEDAFTKDTANPLEVPAAEALRFKLRVAEGFELDQVKAQLDGEDTVLTPDAEGFYTIDAENVMDGLGIKATVKETSSRIALLSSLPASVKSVTVKAHFFSDSGLEKTEDIVIPTGSINENTVPKKEGYYFESASVSSREDGLSGESIAYVAANGEDVYYAIDDSAAYGIKLNRDQGQEIYINYRALGNSVEVDYSTTGDGGLSGNVIASAPVVADRGGELSFQVAHERGYTTKVGAKRCQRSGQRRRPVCQNGKSQFLSCLFRFRRYSRCRQIHRWESR